VTDLLPKVQKATTQTYDLLDKKKFYVDYGTYAKFRRKILKNY
jgi:hypothetical protein